MYVNLLPNYMGNYISTDQNVNLLFATLNEKFLVLHKLLLDIKKSILCSESNNINIIIQNNNSENGFTWDNYEINNIGKLSHENQED